METDYYYLAEDYLESERISFIATEMESLKQMASLYGEVEFLDSYDED